MLPREPGTYVLVLRLTRALTLSVGKLGEFGFRAGWYVYVGSARGPGGLEARVGRHRRKSKRYHWHIDYLRPHLDLAAVWFARGSLRRECKWARALSELPGASMPASGFGASDCGCATHLLHFPARPDVSLLELVADTPISIDRPGCE